MMLQGIVYILTNKNNTTLYTGVTRDLQRRIAEHKLHINAGFSNKYKTEKLVYYEVYDRLDAGIHREKQLKKWHRDWKEKLINDFNPEWKDLAEDIGVDEEYIQSVKDAYDSGHYVAGDSGSGAGMRSLPHNPPSIAGEDPLIAGEDPLIAGEDPLIAGEDPLIAGEDPRSND